MPPKNPNPLRTALTLDEIRYARSLWGSGKFTVEQISTALHTQVEYMRRVVQRETWKDV